MRNYLTIEPLGAPHHTLSTLYDVPVGCVTPASFEAVHCFICGRRRVAVARYRMICLDNAINKKFNHTFQYQQTPLRRAVEGNNYRLLTKYGEIFPPAVVVRQGPELAFYCISIPSESLFEINLCLNFHSNNIKGNVSRKGECSIVRINRLQQFCTTMHCEPSQKTKFITQNHFYCTQYTFQ